MSTLAASIGGERTTSAMSMTESTLSFATARENLSGTVSPQSQNGDADATGSSRLSRAGIKAPIGHTSPEGPESAEPSTTSSDKAGAARTLSTELHVSNTGRPNKTSSTSSSKNAVQSHEHDAFEQADVIAALIQSLHNSDISVDKAHARTSDVYSLQPLGSEELLSVGSPSPSHHTSRSSRKSFQRQRSGITRQLSKSQSRGSNSSERGSKSSKDPLPSPVPSNIDRRASSLAQAENETSAKGSVASEHPGQPTPQIAYPPTGRLIVILLSLYISIFLVALDRTIIGPAIPTITNKFHSIEDIGWYGSAYMLTACGFILLYGRIYTFFPTKRVFLASIALFETGSAICGSAPSSKFLILGRAIAGVGSSGIYTGVLLIIMEITPLHRRPLLQGFFGVCFGLASVAGPLLGGVFTESKATWRWCFFLNLPLGAFTIGVVMFFLHLDEKKRRMDWKETIRQLDPLGTLLFLPSIVCLLLALEWGAAEYRWSDPIIIGLLTVFAVLFVAFVAWQFATRKTTATVPARILLKRSVAFGCLSQFTVGATMLTCTLYIPLWFQAIKGVSAMQSGIRTIPLVLSVVIGSIASGAAVHKIGYYTPFMIMGSLCLSVGAGLLTTWNAGSNSGMWIGYQVILGLGVGFTMQHPNIAIQIVLPKKDVPAGTALLSFWQTLGATLCTSIGQNLFLGNFVHALHNIGGMDPGRVVKAGATELKNAVPAELLSRVLTAYNNSLTGGPFLVCMVVACLSVPAALGMEWHSVKKDKQERTALANPTPDEEAGTSAPPVRDQESEHVVTETAEPSSMESGREKVGDKETSPPPIPRQSSRRNTNRKSGEISRVLVSKLNPDLREDLEMSTS